MYHIIKLQAQPNMQSNPQTGTIMFRNANGQTISTTVTTTIDSQQNVPSQSIPQLETTEKIVQRLELLREGIMKITNYLDPKEKLDTYGENTFTKVFNRMPFDVGCIYIRQAELDGRLAATMGVSLENKEKIVYGGDENINCEIELFVSPKTKLIPVSQVNVRIIKFDPFEKTRNKSEEKSCILRISNKNGGARVSTKTQINTSYVDVDYVYCIEAKLLINYQGQDSCWLNDELVGYSAPFYVIQNDNYARSFGKILLKRLNVLKMLNEMEFTTIQVMNIFRNYMNNYLKPIIGRGLTNKELLSIFPDPSYPVKYWTDIYGKFDDFWQNFIGCFELFRNKYIAQLLKNNLIQIDYKIVDFEKIKEIDENTGVLHICKESDWYIGKICKQGSKIITTKLFWNENNFNTRLGWIFGKTKYIRYGESYTSANIITLADIENIVASS